MGLAQAVTHAANEGKVIVGICGGYQMLGTWVADPDHVESAQVQVRGLGLFQMTTRFQKEKITHQVRARCVRSGEEVRGYEIHHGVSFPTDGTRPAFEILERSGQAVRIHDGACDDSGKLWGSNIHGLFDNASFRRQFLQAVWEARGLSHPISVHPGWNLDHELDRWADLVRAHLDMAAMYRLLEAKR
jgi:adenosylcobyric acid synthase